MASVHAADLFSSASARPSPLCWFVFCVHTSRTGTRPFPLPPGGHSACAVSLQNRLARVRGNRCLGSAPTSHQTLCPARLGWWDASAWQPRLPSRCGGSPPLPSHPDAPRGRTGASGWDPSLPLPLPIYPSPAGAQTPACSWMPPSPLPGGYSLAEPRSPGGKCCPRGAAAILHPSWSALRLGIFFNPEVLKFHNLLQGVTL